jgi:uncharacterized membrane protein YgcG
MKMIYRLSLFLYFLLAVPLFGDKAPSAAQLQKLPPRPSFGVSDAAGLLIPRDKLALEDRLRSIRNQSNAETLIMIMPVESAAAFPSEVVMKRIAENWPTHDFFSVILHCPEQPDFPKIHIGGTSLPLAELPSTKLREIITKIETNARNQNASMQRLDAALSSLAKELAILRTTIDHNAAILQNQKKQSEHTAAAVTLQPQTRALLYFAMAASLIFMIYLVRLILGKKYKVIYFPQTSPRKRFCAPYSGGSGGKMSLTAPDVSAEKD